LSLAGKDLKSFPETGIATAEISLYGCGRKPVSYGDVAALDAEMTDC
jgi:hypothetical protein